MRILCKNEIELLELIEKIVPNNTIVGCRNSVTLEQTGVINLFERGITHIWINIKVE